MQHRAMVSIWPRCLYQERQLRRGHNKEIANLCFLHPAHSDMISLMVGEHYRFGGGGELLVEGTVEALLSDPHSAILLN
jgi:hypothetical protein